MHISDTQANNLKLFINNPILLPHRLGNVDFTSVHNEWLKKGILMKSGEWHLQAYRSSFKSTTMAYVIISRLILYPNETIAIVRKKINHANDFVKMIRLKMESSSFIEFCRFIGLEAPQSTWWKNNEFNTSWRNSVTPEPSLRALSLFQNNTGSHYDWIFSDDLVTIKDRYSINEREKTKRFITDLLNIKTKGIIYSSTPYHPEDATFLSMPIPDKYPFGTIPFSKELTNETLSKKKLMRADEWSINYDLQYIIDANDRFVPDLNFTEDFNLKDNLSIMVIDPAYGGKDTTAVTVGYMKNGNIFVDGFVFKKSIVDLYDRLSTFCLKNNIQEIHVESNKEVGTGDMVRDTNKRTNRKIRREYTSEHNFKKFLFENYEKIKSENNLEYLKIPTVKMFHSSGEKHYRICNNTVNMWSSLYFNDSLQDDYLNQLMMYEEGFPTDDAIDSLSSFISIIKSKNARSRTKLSDFIA